MKFDEHPYKAANIHLSVAEIIGLYVSEIAKELNKCDHINQTFNGYVWRCKDCGERLDA